MIEKKKSSLYDLIEIESWLTTMAKAGYELMQVIEEEYQFEKRTPAKTKHNRYAFCYNWKGKIERPMSLEDANHFQHIRTIPTYNLKIGILTDVTIGLYVLETKNTQMINKFYEYHHADHSRAIRHCWIYRCFICGLIVLSCFSAVFLW